MVLAVVAEFVAGVQDPDQRVGVELDVEPLDKERGPKPELAEHVQDTGECAPHRGVRPVARARGYVPVPAPRRTARSPLSRSPSTSRSTSSTTSRNARKTAEESPRRQTIPISTVGDKPRTVL